MYIDEANLATHHATFWDLVKEVAAAAPSTTVLIDKIGEHILQGRYYQALKLTKELIDYEQEVISRVSKPSEDL
jgi:flagellar protein FlbT